MLEVLERQRYPRPSSNIRYETYTIEFSRYYSYNSRSIDIPVEFAILRQACSLVWRTRACIVHAPGMTQSFVRLSCLGGAFFHFLHVPDHRSSHFESCISVWCGSVPFGSVRFLSELTSDGSVSPLCTFPCSLLSVDRPELCAPAICTIVVHASNRARRASQYHSSMRCLFWIFFSLSLVVLVS